MSAEGELIILSMNRLSSNCTTVHRAGQCWRRTLMPAYLPQFKRLTLEGKAIIKRHFKPLQDNFSLHLIPALNANGQGLFGTSLYDVMKEAQAVLEAALNDMRREPTMGRS